MQNLSAENLGDSDHGVIIRYNDKLTNIELKRPHAEA